MIRLLLYSVLELFFFELLIVDGITGTFLLFLALLFGRCLRPFPPVAFPNFDSNLSICSMVSNLSRFMAFGDKVTFTGGSAFWGRFFRSGIPSSQRFIASFLKLKAFGFAVIARL